MSPKLVLDCIGLRYLRNPAPSLSELKAKRNAWHNLTRQNTQLISELKALNEKFTEIKEQIQ